MSLGSYSFGATRSSLMAKKRSDESNVRLPVPASAALVYGMIAACVAGEGTLARRGAR